jgi:hypothetical protein
MSGIKANKLKIYDSLGTVDVYPVLQEIMGMVGCRVTGAAFLQVYLESIEKETSIFNLSAFVGSVYVVNNIVVSNASIIAEDRHDLNDPESISKIKEYWRRAALLTRKQYDERFLPGPRWMQ